MKYTNVKSQVYYLHCGQTKTGTSTYYFSLKPEGKLCKSIPKGYEIYETPNAQVFLRKTPKKIISDDERSVVENGMRNFSRITRYKIDIKRNAIQIYTPNQDADALRDILDGLHPLSSTTNMAIDLILTYSPNMQFILTDYEKRIFVAQRYCYLGRVDDWIYIGSPGHLSVLVENYLQHLGEESFFDLR